MKTLRFLFTAFTLLLLTVSCEDDNSPIFVAKENTNELKFLNSFASEYLISEETKTNIADRLIWTEPDYGVQANINYVLQGSTGSSFDVKTDSIRAIGSTKETNFAVLVSDLLSFKPFFNIDDKPDTTTSDGLPNNSATIFLRVMAYMGTDKAPVNATYSKPATVAFSLIERAANDNSCDPLYALGDALDGIGWSFPGNELICEADVLEGKVALKAGTFRFFQKVDDWNSGLNYTHYKDAGYSIDSNFEDAQDGDNNFKFIGTDGIYTLQIDNVNKKIALTPSTSLWAVGDAVPGGWGFNNDTVEFVETKPDVWSASIALNQGVFRFFPTFNDWNDSFNYPYYADKGFTIDSNFETQGDSDENFKFIGTPGTFTMTIDAVNKTITLK